MAPTKVFCVDELRRLLRLDAETGLLYWRDREGKPVFNGVCANKLALNHHQPNGYLGGGINYVTTLAHRVVFAMHHGRWPAGQIDHINGKRDDNRPANLREVTALDNARNRIAPSTNTSGRLGVKRQKGKWLASITVLGVRKHLGYFVNFADAVAAREAAEAESGVTYRERAA